MKIVQRLAGDQLCAQYSNTKFYIKQFSILILKAIFVFACSLAFFFVLFFILSPGPTSATLTPVFQVKKSAQKSMITIYTNGDLKKDFCQNESEIYFGKLYSKQEFCQFQHENLPLTINNHNSIDVSLSGMNKNVNFITACIVKVREDRSVCQKFAYSQELRIFNNLNFEDLHSIEVELDLKAGNDFFGEVRIKFDQQISFALKFLKQHYFIISILASIVMAVILTFSFAVFQVPEILEKGEHEERKVKKQ